MSSIRRFRVLARPKSATHRVGAQDLRQFGTNNKDLNFLTGGLTLEAKFELIKDDLINNAKSLLGEAGVSKENIIIGTNKNLKVYGAKNSFGDILVKNQRANGFPIHGNYSRTTPDGYLMFENNKIYLSKRTVRRLIKNNILGKDTFYHEWFHSVDSYTGWTHYYYQTYPFSYNFHLESRAHGFSYSYHPTNGREITLLKYLKLSSFSIFEIF